MRAATSLPPILFRSKERVSDETPATERIMLLDSGDDSCCSGGSLPAPL